MSMDKTGKDYIILQQVRQEENNIANQVFEMI